MCKFFFSLYPVFIGPVRWPGGASHGGGWERGGALQAGRDHPHPRAQGQGRQPRARRYEVQQMFSFWLEEELN